MLPTVMVSDTMVSVMLMLILLFFTEDMPDIPMLPMDTDMLPMLPMAMVLDTMVSVMLMLTLLSSMEDMLAMQDIPMPMVSLILLTWDFVLTMLGLKFLVKMFQWVEEIIQKKYI